jgi:serine/threonine protein kinase
LDAVPAKAIIDGMSADAKRIMLVDDEELSLKVIHAALKHAGYTVVGTTDPTQALALFEKEDPDLAILDLAMPQMDGLTLLGQMREVTQIPIVMLTGEDRSELAVKALKLGAFDYLTKPVNFKRLLETISLALQTEAKRDESRMIAHYEIGEEIGRGGMGAVYEATDLTLKRKVALKVLLPELAADSEFELRFMREAQGAAKISHPGIVTVFEAGRYRGQLYMAMELVRGTTLHSLIVSGHEFTPVEVKDIMLQASEALYEAHKAGLIHRDIKPANLMITSEARLKVLDFGLARVMRGREEHSSETGFAGTLDYASPEQIQVLPIDARTDIYALGVVLYEMLTGVRPFEGKPPFGIVPNILSGSVRRPLSEVEGVPPGLRKLTESMMALSPKDRPDSLSEVARIIRSMD